MKRISTFVGSSILSAAPFKPPFPSSPSNWICARAEKQNGNGRRGCGPSRISPSATGSRHDCKYTLVSLGWVVEHWPDKLAAIGERLGELGEHIQKARKYFERHEKMNLR